MAFDEGLSQRDRVAAKDAPDDDDDKDDGKDDDKDDDKAGKTDSKPDAKASKPDTKSDNTDDDKDDGKDDDDDDKAAKAGKSDTKASKSDGKADAKGRNADEKSDDTGDDKDKDKDKDKDAKDDDDKPETQDERYENHFPQDVRVSDVVGKPMIATDDSSLGTVRSVVRGPDGRLKLIVPFGGFLGLGRRPVAVPIEVVGSIGTAIVSVDMDRAAYVAAPSWEHNGETVLAANDMIRVAITRH